MKLIFHTNDFPLLTQNTTSIWQPFIFYAPSLSPGDKQQGRGEIARATIQHVWQSTCMHTVYDECTWVCHRVEGGIAVSGTHRGRLWTLLSVSHLLLVVGLFCYRGLSPCPTLEAHKRLKTAGVCNETDMLKCLFLLVHVDLVNAVWFLFFCFFWLLKLWLSFPGGLYCMPKNIFWTLSELFEHHSTEPSNDKARWKQTILVSFLPSFTQSSLW